jgi:hypothetical protein
MGQIMKLVPPRKGDAKPSTSMAWLAAIWQAQPKEACRRFLGLQEHISLEAVGVPGRTYLQAWTEHPAAAMTLAAHLSAYFPELAIKEMDDGFSQPQAWASAELALGLSRDRSLRVMRDSDADPLGGILASLECALPEEWRMVQILVRPELEPNLGSLAFQTIIRLIATGAGAKRARNALGTMIAAFGPFGGENALRPLMIRTNSTSVLQSFRDRHWPLLRQRTFLLKLEELASIYHIPSPDRVRNPNLETRDTSVPRECLSEHGIRIGLVELDGRPQVIRLQPKDLLRHVLCVGATGTGKSTLLNNMTQDVIAEGHGISVLDPHGTLVSDILASIPEEHLHRVALIRFSDVEYPVGLNVLKSRPGFEFLVVDELVEICRRIYAGDSWGPVLDMVMRHAAYATSEIGGTLVEMARLLDDDQFRAAILPRVRNPETRRFFQRLSRYRVATREQKFASTMHRLQRFLSTPFVRLIVGQGASNLDIRQTMDEKMVVLYDLSRIGTTNAQFLGSLLTLLYRQAALSRIDVSESNRAPHVLVMDECSWFISRTVGEMADQARKFGLAMVLAAQRLGQLQPEETRDAVFGNVGSVIAFAIGDVGESVYLAQHMNSPDWTAADVRSLGRFEICAQVMHRDSRQAAFRAKSPPPPAPSGNSEARERMILERSRERYALPRDIAEARIESRQRVEDEHEPEKRRR